MSDTPGGLNSEANDSPSSRLALFPPARWLPAYKREWLPFDMIAGVTLAAYAVPVSLAYASLAGLPPQHGLFCYLLGGLCYACFGTSRQLAIGPTSAIAMLVGTTLAGMAIEDPARWVSIATLAALVVAVICLLAWLLRLSVLVSFISETVLCGFKAGAALTIALTQLPKLFGVPGGGEHFFERVWILGGQLPDTNLNVLIFGVAALVCLILGGRFLPGRPVALAVVVLSILVVSIGSLGEWGITVVGALPRGLPEWKLPSLRLRDVDGVIPLAAACFLLAYIEGVSAARTIAQRHGADINPRQELLALGAANLGVAFGQGFPVAGGLSQSAVNDQAGAKTPLSLIFTSLTLAVCLIFLTELLKNLPNVVLASIVLVAVSGLIDRSELIRLWKVSRSEFQIAMVAFAGVLLVGILNGVLLAVVVSLLMVITRTARPHVAFLGRIPGTRRYSDLGRHPDNELVPDALLFRIEASLLYFNAEHVANVVRKRRESQSSSIRLVLCDLSASPYVDLAGARMLKTMHRELTDRGIQFRLAEAHAAVRDILRAEGLEEQIGPLDRRMSVDDIIQQWQRSAQPESIRESAGRARP